MQHAFDTEIANAYGISAAIIFNHLVFWIQKNEANNEHYHDGTYWTYNSRKAYKMLFPYMGERQIKSAFATLINNGLVKTGNYNRVAMDRTLWYALTEKGKCIATFGINGIRPKCPNGRGQNVPSNTS